MPKILSSLPPGFGKIFIKPSGHSKHGPQRKLNLVVWTALKDKTLEILNDWQKKCLIFRPRFYEKNLGFLG